jgi:hypothetical protein
MTREEILRLAAAKADTAQGVMALAHEMLAFMEGEKPPLVLLAPANSRQGMPWKAEEITRLLKMRKDGTPEHDIAAALGRNTQSVRTALYKLDTGRQLGKPK